MKVVTSEQMRELENAAIKDIGIPSIVLMENAAIQISAVCLEYLIKIKGSKAVIVAGTGRNGGDGLAVARHLHMNGIDVGIILVGNPESLTDETFINYEIVKNMNIPIKTIPITDNLLDIPYTIETCDLVVDGLFGTGLNRKLEDIYEYMVDVINTYAKYTISIDMPSGINADNGKVMGIAVKSDETVTLGLPKLGLLLYPGTDYAGKITIKDISLPSMIQTTTQKNSVILTETLTENEAGKLLPHRKPRSNKSTYGKTLVFAGCKDMPGAAMLTCKAVYKAGGGYVIAHTVQSVAGIIQQTAPEVIAKSVSDVNGYLCSRSVEESAEVIFGANVIVAGPGLGRSDSTAEFVKELLKIADVPVVLDADALYAISGEPGILSKLRHPCVITPHPGEMSRLTGINAEEILDNSLQIALEFARENNVITVLKDARTIVASPNGQAYINTTGNAALSKAGSGDVLTGIIGGFISQGMNAFKAAALAVYIHGKAGEMASDSLSMYGVNASDIINYVPLVIKELIKKRGN